MRDIAKAAAEDIQGAFRDLFLEGTDSLEDFASQFGETLRRVAANFLANQAIQFLLGENFDGGAGQIGGIAGKIGGLFGGGGGSAKDTSPGSDTAGEALATAAGIGAENLFDPKSFGLTAGDAMAETVQAGGGFFQGITSLFGGLFSSIGGGIGSAVGGIAGLFAGGLAGGGGIGRGQFAVVGEDGPEIATGPATITPMGGMMPAPEVNVSIANISDPRAAVDAVGATNAGAKGIVNQISENVEEIQRILGQA